MKLSPIFPLILSLALLLSACVPTALQAADAATASAAMIPQKAISWSEFGRTLHLTYDTSLAQSVEARTVPAIPYSPDIMYPESHPAYAAFRFTGYQEGKPFQLPYPMQDAQVMVFQTQDFPGFGSDVPRNFASQQQALSELLQLEQDLGRCGTPLVGYDQALPFLPWLNARQMFCSQPKVIDFRSGRGIRYLTHFTQDDGPVLESMLFYTFQGLSEDGKFYISAVFPVQAGIFPTQPPDCPKCGDPSYDPRPDWQAALAEQLAHLNNLPEDQFFPSLSVLDAMIQSIQIKAQ
jgi:hypothetical protein